MNSENFSELFVMIDSEEMMLIPTKEDMVDFLSKADQRNYIAYVYRTQVLNTQALKADIELAEMGLKSFDQTIEELQLALHGCLNALVMISAYIDVNYGKELRPAMDTLIYEEDRDKLDVRL